MIRDDDWVKVAMENDVVVVELLIQLHQAASPPPPTKTKTDTISLETWSVRQPRSKPISLNSINNNNNKDQPKPPPTRSSPTTPLSWSGGGATASGGSGSPEESSRRPSPPTKTPDALRSKVISGTIASKRPRKKKTLAELKEEEMLLMNEKKHLKKELEVLRLNLENQRAINQNYKRLKIDKQAAAKAHDEPNQNVVSCLLSWRNSCDGSRSRSRSHDDDVTLPKNGFSLPDLNIAFEEEI